MRQNLQALLDQLSPEERQGATLKVRVPKDTPIRTRTPQTLQNEVRQVIAARAVGEALAKARKQAGLKAKDVAAALEVSAPRVAQVESLEANLTLMYYFVKDSHKPIMLAPQVNKLPLACMGCEKIKSVIVAITSSTKTCGKSFKIRLLESPLLATLAF